MAWQDDIYDTASFRGVEFFVDSHDVGGIGRRLARHEYPGRRGFAEDMGPKSRDYSFRAYVLGDDYITRRDQLIDALDAPGPGELIHPFFGRFYVRVDDAGLSETTADGGKATFTLAFVPDTDNAAPEYSIATQDDVHEKAEAIIGLSAAELENTLDAASLPEFSRESLADRLNELSTLLGAEADKLDEKLSQPGVMATALHDAVRRAMATTYLALENLLSVDSSWPKVPLDTPARRQQARNQHAIATFVKTTAVASYASVLAGAEFTSQQESQAALVRLSDAVDAVQGITDPFGQPLADATWQALQAVRTSVAADIRERGLRLPDITRHTPATTLPALLIAHQLYGDATQAADIVQRNNIVHPGFVPGGVALEVLKHG